MVTKMAWCLYLTDHNLKFFIMIAKKSKKADLERKRFAFFQIGLVVAGSITLAAFEYTSASVEKKRVTQIMDDGLPMFIPEPVFDPLDRPQPQEQHQSSVQTTPESEVTIVNSPLNPNAVFTNTTVVVTEPCDDCDVIGDLVDDTPKNGIIDVAEVDPQFPGGFKAMNEFIASHIDYPQLPFEMGVQGIVYVQFVVNTDGSIVQVKSQNKLHPDLEAEAERVVRLMPKWIPGEQAGKKVRVRYTVPINYVIH